MLDKFQTVSLLVVCVAIAVISVVMQLPPCPVEDSTMCYWNASTRGNMQGHSFISLWEGFAIVF